MSIIKVTTLNANGIRSAHRKGFFTWVAKQKPDVVCLQEIRAHPGQLSDTIRHPSGYHTCFHAARKKGYSGVAIYSRNPPDAVRTRLGWPEADDEGRFIQADFGPLSVASLYLPSGSSGPERQAIKFAFLRRLLPILRERIEHNRHYILCGDWNIAHRKLDLKNWRGNQQHSGFLPEERAWLDTLFHELGWVDAYRTLYPHREQYTWWSNRGQARANNTGWRIDYQIISPTLRHTLRAASVLLNPQFSDHAPLTIEYELSCL